MESEQLADTLGVSTGAVCVWMHGIHNATLFANDLIIPFTQSAREAITNIVHLTRPQPVLSSAN